jgi:hypothetical protein
MNEDRSPRSRPWFCFISAAEVFSFLQLRFDWYRGKGECATGTSRDWEVPPQVLESYPPQGGLAPDCSELATTPPDSLSEVNGTVSHSAPTSRNEAAVGAGPGPDEYGAERSGRNLKFGSG